MKSLQFNFLKKKQQTLKILISAGLTKELLGKDITGKHLNVMDEGEMKAHYKVYELNFFNKIGNSFNNTIFVCS